MAEIDRFISAEEERRNTKMYQSNLNVAFVWQDIRASLRSTLFSWGISRRPTKKTYRHVASPFSRFWLFENVGGEIYFEDTGITRSLEPGQCYIITPGHPFVVTSYPGAVLYYAHFSAIDWTGQRIFRHAPVLYETESSIELLKKAWQENNPGSALLLLIHITSEYLVQDWDNLKDEYQFCTKFNAVFDYMTTTPPALHRVGAMAEAMDMAQSAFSRYFHKVMKVTPKEYLNRYYLERAIDYLCGSEETISQIAYHLGHTELSNFFHTFRRLTGVSPTEYRAKKVRTTL